MMRQNFSVLLRQDQKSTYMDAGILRYLRAHTTPPDDVLSDLAAETAALPEAEMQIPPEQGTLLTILTSVVAPERAIEIGTFTGYSALCIARGLPAGGRLLCLDVSEEWTAIAQRYWKIAGVDDRVELRIGPAADTLAELPAEPTFGLAFLDADKPSYITYYELLIPRMLPGGLILVDNVFQYGEITDVNSSNPSVQAIRRFNDHVGADHRVQSVMVPIADGLTIVRRLP
ncbi:MAG: O-methyltransferase [Frankia sp.]|nr:O-methyltransferase [Frankia sp.]